MPFTNTHHCYLSSYFTFAYLSFCDLTMHTFFFFNQVRLHHARAVFIPSTLNLRLVHSFSQRFLTHTHYISEKPRNLLLHSLIHVFIIDTLQFSSSILHESILVTLHTLREHIFFHNLHIVSFIHPRTPILGSTHPCRHYQLLIQLPLHNQTYTPDVERHLQCTKGF